MAAHVHGVHDPASQAARAGRWASRLIEADIIELPPYPMATGQTPDDAGELRCA
jgi:hypothetical protein